jgi:WD40 repeat protein/tRNA A-37 threonylcarbamoyl transferase component Bud32
MSPEESVRTNPPAEQAVPATTSIPPTRAPGQPLPEDSDASDPDSEKTCPQETTDTPAFVASMPEYPDVPGYEILGRLGQGGMGIVYKARQRILNRLVALKMVLAGAHARPQDLVRFLAEAETVARLQHPHIVQIHDIGQQGGLPYLALEYAEGGSLAQKLRGTPLSAIESARLVETLARTMHFAHERGIVHRDLKPANVLLTLEGTPKVTDFGLAKTLEGSSGLTRTGDLLGTPSYMAPEQVEGRSQQIGPVTDIWALGAILYEMLTGRPPFKAASPMETLRLVSNQEPEPPGQLEPRVPRDLETICLKCLEKEATKRYANAWELADDLGRFLRDEPVLARPAGKLERLGRWCRRNPTVAALVVFVAVLLLAGTVGSTIAAIWLARIAADAEQARLEAVRQEEIARAEQAQAQEARGREREALADLNVTHGLTVAAQGDPAQAVLWFAHAARLAGGDAEQEAAHRARVRFWSRRVPTPVRALPHPGQRLAQIAFHPQGRYLLAVSQPSFQSLPNRLTLWDLAEERPLPWPGDGQAVGCAVWGPDGRSVILGLRAPDGGAEVHSFPGGELLQRIDVPGPVLAMTLNPDGNLLVLAGRSVRVWDLKKRAFVTPELPHPAAVRAVVFSTAGDRLATACQDNRARVFAVPGDAEKPRPLFPPVSHRWYHNTNLLVSPPAFLPRGKVLLTVTDSADADWARWDTRTGERLPALSLPRAVTRIASHVVASSSDGDHIAVGGFSGAHLWDTTTDPPTVHFLEHRNYVTSLTFSPDGRTLLTASEDRTARLWSVADGTLQGPAFAHQASLDHAAFSADGRLLATAQQDGLVRVWAPAQGDPVEHQLPIGPGPTFAALSPDGRAVIATGAGWWEGKMQQTRAFEVATGKPLGPPLDVGGLLTNAALSPDGRQAVTLASLAPTRQERDAPKLLPEGKAGRLQFWELAMGQKVFEPLPMPSEPRGLAYSPDGSRVVAVCGGGQILVIDSAKGQVIRRLQHGSPQSALNRYPSARFTPDGIAFITWGPDNAFRVWDTETGQPRCPPLAHEGACYDLDFSPDGRLAATSGWDNKVRIWDLQNGKSVAGPLPHPEWVFSCRFSPDGRYLLSGCRDHMARLWDWRTGRQVRPPFRHDDVVFSAAFTPDGRWAVTASRDDTARVWDCATGKPVSPPFELGGWGWSALVTSDGRHAVVPGWRRVLHVFDLADLARPADLSVDDLCVLGEILSGVRINEGDVTGLTTQEWLERWRGFRQRHPDDWPPTFFFPTGAK